MERLAAAMAAVMAAVSLSALAGTEYVVYRGTETEALNYTQESPGQWTNRRGKLTTLAMFEVVDSEDGKGGPTLQRLLIIDYGTAGTNRYFEANTVSEGTWLVDMGDGTVCLTGAQVWSDTEARKDGSGGLEAHLLVGKSSNAAPKTFQGVSLTVAPGEEIRRSDLKFRLDTKLSAAAQSTADANPGDPYTAAMGVLTDYLRALGYSEVLNRR